MNPAPLTVARWCLASVFGLAAFGVWGLAWIVESAFQAVVGALLWVMLWVLP